MDDMYKGLLQGDARAWQSLYEKTSPGLYRFLCARVNDPTIAEELMQEGFCRLASNLPKIKDSKAVSAWLYSTCYNLAMDYYRKEHVSDKLPVVELPTQTTREDDPLVSLVQGETDQVIREAVMSLSDSQRDVVVLRIWCDLSYAEISDITGVAEGTLRSQFYWAIRKLRKLLDKKHDLCWEVCE